MDIDVRELKRLREQGLSMNEIGERLNVSAAKAYYELGKLGLAKRGTTKTKKKCPSCIYRGDAQGKNGCDYILITGHRRGCSVDECIKYEKGKRKQSKKEEEVVQVQPDKPCV